MYIAEALYNVGVKANKGKSIEEMPLKTFFQLVRELAISESETVPGHKDGRQVFFQFEDYSLLEVFIKDNVVDYFWAYQTSSKVEA